MNLRERWESRQPLARVAFFGALGPEEDALYDMAPTGDCLLSLAVDRRGHLARVLVPSSHLIYIVDKTPRQASGAPADCRIVFANDRSLDVVLSTIRMSSAVRGMWSCMVYYLDSRVRALVSEHAIREIVPLRDDDEDVVLLTVSDVFDDELWPELRHKRREV